MKTLIDVLAVGVIDSSGDTLSEGVVYFYESGTTTLSTVYQDYDFEDPHPNPATLNEAGVLEAYTNKRLRIVIEDFEGNAVRIYENVGIEDADVQDAISGTDNVPPGVVDDYAGDTAPLGWLMCDGDAVSRTTYAALFAAIGINWGAGDGSTTFNLPDLQGRVCIGAGTGTSLSARVLAETGGEEEHTLLTTEAAVAAHTHTLTAEASHVHQMFSDDDGDSVLTASNIVPSRRDGTGDVKAYEMTYVGPGGAAAAVGQSGAGSSHTHTVGTHAGSSSADPHNNMQPYGVLNKIIKT